MDHRLIHPSSFPVDTAAARANSEAVNNMGNEAMCAALRSTGKSIKSDELIEKIVETPKMAKDNHGLIFITRPAKDPSDTFGKAAKGFEFMSTEVEIDVPILTEKEKDPENDPRYDEKTGMQLPYGREQNYLALRSRAARRRRR